jgi:hypothetical protein
MLPRFATENFSVGDEITVERRRQLDRDLDGLVVGDGAEF